MTLMIFAVVGVWSLWASWSGATYTDTAITLSGVKGAFKDGVSSAETVFQDLTTRIPATTKIESFAWLGAFPQMRQMVDGRKVQGIKSETYNLENAEYESTIEFDQTTWEDDQIGALSLQTKQMAAFAETHKDFLLGALLINGDAADALAYDGNPFFDTDRVFGDSAAQSNLLSYDAVDPDAPTVAEFRGALAQAMAQMISLRNDKNQPFRTALSGLVCVVPPSMLFTASEAINATLVNSTDNILKGVARVVTMPDLTEPSEWYLLKTNAPVGPLVFHDRLKLEFDFLGPDSEYAKTKGKLLATVRGRYTMAYAHWHLAIKTAFDAAAQ